MEYPKGTLNMLNCVNFVNRTTDRVPVVSYCTCCNYNGGGIIKKGSKKPLSFHF